MTNAKDVTVVLYSTPACPDCHAVKRWLTEQGIPFDERDLTDPDIAEEAKARTGVRVAPITLVNGQVFYGTFADQKPRLSEALKLAAAI